MFQEENHASQVLNLKNFIFITFIASFLFLSNRAAYAGEAEEKVPPFITAGLKGYATGGPESAIKAWIKGSAMEMKVEESLGYAESFKQIEEFYGRYLSYHLIEAIEITDISRVVSISMNFEKGPIFAKFLSYKTDKGWILVSFDFNTKPEMILPGFFIR